MKNGEGGIRTRGTVNRTLVFETSSISHSDTSPCSCRNDRPHSTLHFLPGKQKSRPGLEWGAAGIRWRISQAFFRVAAASGVFGACRWLRACEDHRQSEYGAPKRDSSRLGPLAAATRSRMKTVSPAWRSAVCILPMIAATVCRPHPLESGAGIGRRRLFAPPHIRQATWTWWTRWTLWTPPTDARLRPSMSSTLSMLSTPSALRNAFPFFLDVGPAKRHSKHCVRRPLRPRAAQEVCIFSVRVVSYDRNRRIPHG